jgi:hypothetical protein
MTAVAAENLPKRDEEEDEDYDDIVTDLLVECVDGHRRTLHKNGVSSEYIERSRDISSQITE